MKKALAAAIASLVAVGANAQTEIYGTVDSKCVVVSETSGIYGNPSPNLLTTDPTNGGVQPIIRYDVISASFYKARIAYPDDFSSSPNLDDVVEWTGSVVVSEVSDADMSDYDTNKITYNNITEYDLTVAGSTWFKISSAADYGYNKSFPAGSYNAVVEAECIPL
jgi:predicted porin|tara:strand:+ start:223 stop:717 length:495 start_codon:yes stop_codon:yes gene_type:complete